MRRAACGVLAERPIMDFDHKAMLSKAVIQLH
jgi:hypothetical protein